MSDRTTYKKKLGDVSVLFPLILMLFINPSSTGMPSINSVSVHTMEEDVKKTPNEWENLTNIPQPDVGYAHVFNESIYFIGKEAVQVYNPLTDTWELIKDAGLTGDHTSGGSVLLGDCIYFLYGWNYAVFYNISENQFIEFERSSILRTDIAIAELNGLIYVSGGWLSTSFTSLVLLEVYDPETNIWSEVASMNVGRKRHEMIALDGHLYAIGGEIEESFIETTKSVERYNHTTNTWEIMNVPSYSYSNFGVTETDNHNFVITHFATEVYNASSGKWLRGPDLYPTFRDILHPALTYYNGCVYAIGGQQFIEGNDCFNSVYRWNISTHKFVVLSRTPTIIEFLEIWPRVFPTILIIVLLMTILVIPMSLISALFEKTLRVKRLKENLFQKGYPAKITGFKGHLKSNIVFIIPSTLIAVLLMPVISFLPIILDNATFRITNLWLMGLIPAFLLTYFLVLRVYKKYDHPKLFFFSGGIGLHSFSSDLLIPAIRLRRIYIDQHRKWVALRIKFRIFPEFWATQYFAFDSVEKLDTFTREIKLMTNLQVEPRSLSSMFLKFLIIPHKNVMILASSDLENHLHPKTLRVLEGEKSPKPLSFEDQLQFPKADSSEIQLKAKIDRNHTPNIYLENKNRIKFCPRCRKERIENASFCISCGYRFPKIPNDDELQQLD